MALPATRERAHALPTGRYPARCMRFPGTLEYEESQMTAGEVLIVVGVGAAAGAVATWVMGMATTLMYNRENRAAREREDRVRGDRTAYEVAAENFAAILGRKIDRKQRARWGLVIHWALGIAAGIVYAFIRLQIPAPNILHGLLFGFVFWLVIDEFVVYVLRLTPGPLEFPWQAHARGLVGHLVFGAVAELGIQLLGAVD
jgi:XapX domain-containing protein